MEPAVPDGGYLDDGSAALSLLLLLPLLLAVLVVALAVFCRASMRRLMRACAARTSSSTRLMRLISGETGGEMDAELLSPSSSLLFWFKADFIAAAVAVAIAAAVVADTSSPSASWALAIAAAAATFGVHASSSDSVLERL